VQPIDTYPDLLPDACSRSRRAGRISGLRAAHAGPLQFGLYEHSFLADTMGSSWWRAAISRSPTDIV